MLSSLSRIDQSGFVRFLVMIGLNGGGDGRWWCQGSSAGGDGGAR